MEQKNKLMSAYEAISRFVKDGDCLALGGFVTNRRPYALVRELIRQGVRGLYVESGAAGGDIDMLIGAGCVAAISVSYVANSGFTQVCRRFRESIERGELLFEDYSLDVQTIAYHAAALGLSYVPVSNMLGSDLEKKWGISEQQRREHPKLPPKKIVIQRNPFDPTRSVCCIPAPKIDVALIHAQAASADGTVYLEGSPFQDVDLAIAARHTVVSCEQLLSSEEIRRHPDRNAISGLCVDAVVLAPFGAHPAQCAGLYDYDAEALREYDQASRTQKDFDAYLEHYVLHGDHEAYLAQLGAERLTALRVDSELGYVPSRPGI